MRLKTCINKIFIPRDSSYGLKHSRVGNCITCNIENDEACKCINYLEAVVDEEEPGENGSK